MTLLERFEWVLQERGTNPNRWSEGAGLERSTVRGIIRKLRNGENPNPTRKTLISLARAANVSVGWLSGGSEPREPFTEPESEQANDATYTPPPVSAMVLSEDAVDNAINRAFDPAKHLPSDVIPVREVLGEAVKIIPTIDLLTYARHLLDSAARLREMGRKVRTNEFPFVVICELAQRLKELEEHPKINTYP